MRLEKKIKEVKRRIIPVASTFEVLEQIKRGKKFIPVDKDIDVASLPNNYMLIDVQYKGDSFKTVVPVSVMIFMSNPGEGNIDDALDLISDFYDEVKDFEEENIENGDVNIQSTNWAVTARSSYKTYLLNKLIEANKEEVDLPVWNGDVLDSLDLNDDYVMQRVRAMAAVALGLSVEQVKSYDVGDMIKHVTINDREIEDLTKKEFNRVACWAGSHYEIKTEFRGTENVEYQVEYRHDKKHRIGKKITKKHNIEIFNTRIDEIEKEIEKYRKDKHKSIGRHDQSLIRQYANIEFIAKENPNNQLPLIPPVQKNGK
jgi:hypothetical protein